MTLKMTIISFFEQQVMVVLADFDYIKSNFVLLFHLFCW